MTQKISPFLEGKYGWDFGESGWNSGMDENLLKFSFLFDRNVDSIVSTLPTASDGQAHYNTTDNRLYFAVGTTYYSTPVPKWFVITIRDTGTMWQFNGTSLVQLEGTQNLDTRLDSVELTISTLGTAAYEDVEFFATQSELDVAAAQASSYTDNVIGKKGIVSVRDYITTPVDGTTSNQAGIVEAVAYCYDNGCELHWPAGTYVSTGSIPNFHSVAHTGNGVIKRGGSTFKLAQGADHVNELFVSTSSGSDGNDGLSADFAVKTASRATALLASEAVLPRLADGVWRVRIAAGTYAESAVFELPVANKKYLEILGEVGVDGVPTVVFDGTGLTSTAGLYFTGPKRVKVKDVKAMNYRGNSVASGLVFANRGVDVVLTENVHTYNNLWTGINADNIGQLYLGGGVHDANTNYNLRVRGNVGISIGYRGNLPGNRVTLKNGTVGIQLRDCSAGHFDYVDIMDCDTGVWVTNVSRITLNDCSLTRIKVGVVAGQSSTFSYDPSTTFTDVPTKYRHVAGGCNDTDPAGEMLTYDAFFNRFGVGLKQWTTTKQPASNVAHAWGTNKTGTASFSYLVPDATSAQMLWGDVTAPSKMAMLAELGANRFRFIAGGVALLFIDETSANSGRDNLSSLGTASARWSTVYAGTGTINTSDERSKQQIKPVDDAALRAWSRVEYVQYKFNDAVEQKGDGARWHFGLLAQRVKDAFESEGLDAFEYGLLCYDEWDETQAVEEQRDEGGNIVVEATPYRPAGNRYGIRYEEALSLEAALMRQTTQRLEARLSALEGK